MNALAKASRYNSPIDILQWRCEVPYRRPQYDWWGFQRPGNEAWGTVSWVLGFGSTKAKAERMAEETCTRHRLQSMEDLRRHALENAKRLEGDNRGAQPTGTAGKLLDPGAS